MYQPGKRLTREELYEAAWSNTIGALVKQWKTNYLQVNEACRRLQVPRPKQGYWQWIMRGRLVKRKPLRRPTRRLPAEWVLLTRVKSPRHVAVAAARGESDEEELVRGREEQRKREEIREREQEQRKAEERNRERLEESSCAWWNARRLRRFIRACEVVLQKDGQALPVSSWQRAWLAWAREYADRLDPMTSGYLDAEKGRFTADAGGGPPRDSQTPRGDG
jgi:hypothetical protein